MSIFESDGADRPKAMLVVTAPAGVGIQVIDGQFKLVAEGPGPLELHLPVGVYTLRAIAAGGIREQTIRLLPIEPLRVRLEAPAAVETATPASSSEASDREQAQARAAQAFTSASAPDRSAEVLVFARSDDKDLIESLQGLDLFPVASVDQDKAPPRPKPSRIEKGLEEGWLARRFSVEPGVYALRAPIAGKTAGEVSIYAFAGRRTVVFLKCAEMPMLQPTKAGYEQALGIGVDLSQTTVTSSLFDRPVETGGLCVRLTDTILHSLLWGGDNLDGGDVETVLQANEPFLLIYAAAQALRTLETQKARDGRGLGAPLSEAVPSSRPLDPGHVARMLMAVPDSWEWPDVQSIAWRLEQLAPGALSIPSGLQMKAPPLLAVCWSWASALSISRPEIAVAQGRLKTATEHRLAAGPWLAWEHVDFRLQDIALGRGAGDLTSDEAVRVIGQLVSEVGRITEASKSKSLSAQIDEALDKLSPTAQRLANSAVLAYRAVSSIDSEAEADPSPEQVAAAFAGTAGGVANSLVKQVEATLKELSRATRSFDEKF